MALSKDVVIRLLGDSNSAVAAQKAAADAAGVTAAAYRRAEREMDKQTRAAEASARKQRAAMDDVGRGAAVMGAAMVAGLGMAVKAAIDWESAWAGVTKTLPDDADFAATEKGLRDLARTLPATHQEIAAVAEAAGQLGVAADAIVPFTKTMIDLGETTNLSADEAATSIAQMMNVMQTAPDDVGRLGAALVELGNNGASTEADIMKMTSYLVGSAALIGASESDVLALANTMTSLGINAERGGGVMTRTMQDIYTAVQSGGDALDGFAEVAGMSADEFAQAFEADPIRAIGAFTDGLAAAKGRGDNVVEMLGDLGIKGTQDTAVLLQMAGAQGMLSENLDMGARAWEDNNALVEEAAKRYDTTAAQMEIARNSLTEAGIEIGESLLPVLASVAESVAGVAQWFADLPDPIKDVVTELGSVAGVAGLAAGAFLLLAPRAVETYKAFKTLTTNADGAANGLGKVGKAAGVAGAIWAVAQAADALKKSLGPAPATMEETTAALLGMGDSIEGVDALFQVGNASIFADDIDGLADAAKDLTDPSTMDRLNDFGSSVNSVFGLGSTDGRPEREAAIAQFKQVGETLAFLVDSGKTEMAAEQFDMLAAEVAKGGMSTEELLKLMPGYEEALKGVENEQTTAAQSAADQAAETQALAANLDVALGSIEGYAAAMGYNEEQTEALVKKTQELGTTLADFINPLGVYQGMLDEKAAAEEAAAIKSAEAAGKSSDAWRDFVVDSGFNFDEYMRRLEEQVTAQANWQTNMLRLAGRVSQGTLDELKRMGPEGAPLVADLVNRSDAELDKFDDVMYQRSAEATGAMATQLTLAAPVLAQIGAALGQGVVDDLVAQLQAGTTTVADIAKFFGINIAGGINPVLVALGRREIHMATGRGYQAADGAIFDFYANGGVREDHVAQIARPGDWRVWAEPETGGEAYIPLAPGKRTRSLDIWRETGRRLGINDIEMYANGGFSSASDVPRPPSTAPFRAPISTAGDAAMQKMYDETVAWVAANTAASGPIGAGTVGGSWQAIWAKVHAQFPAARKTSDFRPGDPGFHGRGKAVDVAGPRPGDAAAMMAINRWAAATMGANLAELIYTPGINLYRGRPHTYGAATRADHYDHVHLAAMAKGGIFNPHVRDQGGPLLPGYTFNGLNRPELVVPGIPVGSGIPVGAGSQFASGPIDLSPQTIERLGAVMLRGAGAAVGAHSVRQNIDQRSWQ